MFVELAEKLFFALDIAGEASEIPRKGGGDDKLKVIATELTTAVRITTDWTLRESAHTRIKVLVKRIQNKYGYPPDLQEEGVKTVLAA